MIPLLKRIFCFVLAILIPIALFPVSAFASYSPTTGEDFVVVVSELYGAYNNVTSATYSNGPVTTQVISGATDYIINLYNEYAQSASDPYTAAALGAALLAAGCLAVIYDSVTGQGKVALYMDQYISSMDGYWDYAMNDMGFLRDQDGFFVWEANPNGTVDPVNVTSFGAFLPVPATSADYSSVLSSGVHLYTTGQYQAFFGSQSGSYLALVTGVNPGRYTVYFFSSSSDVVYQAVSPINRFVSYGLNLSNGIYYYSPGHFDNASYINSTVPIFSSYADAEAAFISSPSGTRLDFVPSSYIDQINQIHDQILFPDIHANDYLPQGVIINTNLDWDDSWGTVAANPTPGVYYRVTDSATQDRAVPDILDAIFNNDVQVEAPTQFDEPSDSGGGASEVFVPLLPVHLPDFNFSLSGIWYYVVQWVQSIGSWVSLMFSVWASLPQAIVYPVYATAVIVIVLGVYKRFFM